MTGITVLDNGTVNIVTEQAGAEMLVTEVPGRTTILTELMQGPPGPSGTDSFDADLNLIYQIAKL